VAALPFASVLESDRERVIATIVSAFVEDPVERLLWPDEQQYLTNFSTFVGAFGGEAFASATLALR
jgi:hypothetical protein